MVVYTLEQRWEVDADFGKKNHFFRLNSFWSWRVCKQLKLSHLGHRKPAYIEKPTHPKRVTVWCGFWSRGIIFLRKWARKSRYSQWRSLSGHVERILKEEDISNIWFHQDGATCHTAEATLHDLRPVFEDRIISRRADVVWTPRSFDLTPLDHYLWDAVKNKCYANKPETIDALKDIILIAIGEIQLHTIDNVLKNWTDRVGYLMASRWMIFQDCTFK